MTGSTPATLQSYERLLAVDPVLSRIAPLGALVPGLPEKTLFHAGPPFAGPLPAPMRNSALAAILHEGWADTPEAAAKALSSGVVTLSSAQDIGVVTPLAFILGPSVYCLGVSDAKTGAVKYSPLNDGPLPDCLRLGTGRPAGLALLRSLTDGIGADLAANLKPTPLLPVLAKGLAGGDDLHGRVMAAQAEVRGFFGPGLKPESEAYLTQANQFVLNVIMPAAALMIGAGAGVPGSEMVVASAGNGVQHGYKLAGDPDRWIVRPANRPIGGRMPGHEGSQPLPAIGDSAVIDALGLGAACLRFAPDLAGLKDHVDAAYFAEAAHDAFIGPHPALPGVKVGLDLTRPRACLGVMLGMVGETGSEGLIGRGVAPWPQ